MSIIDSILAGIAYGMGVTVWFFIYDGSLLSLTIGSVCFAIILMAIPYYRLDFFIGRPGVLSDKNMDLVEGLIVYMGNFIGTMWIGVMIKLFGSQNKHMVEIAHFALEYLKNESWDTILVISILGGMMFYAGAMAVNRGHTPFYFMLAAFVCMMAHWPMIHAVWYAMWIDTWAGYWYLIIPVTLGNLIGSNVWYMLRKHSPTYQNQKYITPDSYDIVDRFRDFVRNSKNSEDPNKDNHSDK